MSPRNMKRTKKKILSEIRSEEGFYDVIKLFDKDTTLFDCIPDNWFVDEEKTSLLWPPSKGKSVAIRALKREEPDETWERYNCEVVKEGFATYSLGQALVREKCAQKYNTSSAEEQVNAAKFRRLHPGLSLSVSGSFEDVFKKQKSIESSGQENTFAIDITSEDLNENTSVADVFSKNDIQLESQIATPTKSTVSSMALDRVHHSNVFEGHAKSHSSFKRQAKHSDTVHEMGTYLEEKENVITSPENNRRSESANSPSINHAESSSRKKVAAVFERAHRRSCSQDTEGSNARSQSSLSDGRRNRSTSRQSHASTNGLSRNEQHSERMKSPSTSRSSSRRGERENPVRVYPRGRSQQSERSSASSSVSSVRHLGRSHDNLSSSQFRPHGNDKCCSSSYQSRISIIRLMKEVNDLKKTVCKNHQENDRRLTRMEVTINKTLVRLGDITRLTAGRGHSRDSDEDLRSKDARSYGESSRRQRHQFRDENSSNQRREDFSVSRERQRLEEFGGTSGRQRREDFGDSSRRRPCEDPQNRGRNSIGFVDPKEQRMCALPISSLSELTAVNQQLMKGDFFTFLVHREMEFCTPGKNTTTNVVITTYLKRFISLRVRSLLTLKELQGDQGMTLYADFHYVYMFLIEVARQGYKSCNRSLAEKEANEALRIVWGRTKQMLSDEQKKKK